MSRTEDVKRRTTTLNEYAGTSRGGVRNMVVAPDMETAAAAYVQQNGMDPTVLQLVQEGILVTMPESWVSFKTTVAATDPVQTPIVQGLCTATPEQYTLLAGTKQVFTATEATGWQFVKWTIGGVDVQGEEGTKKVALLTIPPSATVLEIRAVYAPKVV